MRFKALACDYDGTLASGDRLGPEVTAALDHARSAGVHLILVTGRTFFELTRVCERLDLFDAVIAENGGVLHHPAAALIRDLAPPPPPRLLIELDRRGIPYQRGRVIVGVARADEPDVREALAAADVTCELIYNRAAMMLLPQGVSKATGVEEALRGLGLSLHDVLALGDAENDLALFAACGYAGCPASAAPEIQERADWVFPGANGLAIAAAIAGPILGDELPAAPAARHRLEIGWAVGTGERVTVPARGINLLIHGDPQSGKSWLAGALVERFLGHRYAVCVLDPEGDYRELGQLPGVTWTEVTAEQAIESQLRWFERDPASVVVADLSDLPHAAKLRTIERGLGLLVELRRRLGLPHWIVLDEAHYSLHREGIPVHALPMAEKGVCLVTYRPSWLTPSVVQGVDLHLLARTTAPEELAFLSPLLGERSGGADRLRAVLDQLPQGEYVLIEPGSAGPHRALSFIAVPRGTPHVRHLRKYADTRLPPEQWFVFRQANGRDVGVADSLAHFREALATVRDEVLAYHAEQHDFSRWVTDCFADTILGAQLRKTETRWRRQELSDLRAALDRLIGLRYGTER